MLVCYIKRRKSFFHDLFSRSITWGYMEIQGVTRGYRELQGVARGYGGYRGLIGLQGITRAYQILQKPFLWLERR